MKTSEKVLYFLTGLSAPLFVWMVASYANVVMHNTTDYCYAWWNAFKILF